HRERYMLRRRIAGLGGGLRPGRPQRRHRPSRRRCFQRSCPPGSNRFLPQDPIGDRPPSDRNRHASRLSPEGALSTERLVALFVGALLVAGTAAFARSSRQRGDGMVTPLTAFLAAWSLDLLLFAVPWVHYSHTSARAWGAIYASILAFVIGCVLATRGTTTTRAERPQELDAAKLRLTWLACFVLGLIGFADFVHA